MFWSDILEKSDKKTILRHKCKLKRRYDKWNIAFRLAKCERWQQPLCHCFETLIVCPCLIIAIQLYYNFKLYCFNFFPKSAIPNWRWAYLRMRLIHRCYVYQYVGYWPSMRSRWLDIGPNSFFVCYELRQSRGSLTHTKKNEAIIQPFWQAWSIKDLLYGFQENFSCGTQQVVLSRQESSILPAQVADDNAGFDSSCPPTELAI